MSRLPSCRSLSTPTYSSTHLRYPPQQLFEIPSLITCCRCCPLTLPLHETAILVLISYAAYAMGEVIELSGIMALFFCGIVLSHYNWYNLSASSKVASHNVFAALAMVRSAHHSWLSPPLSLRPSSSCRPLKPLCLCTWACACLRANTPCELP